MIHHYTSNPLRRTFIAVAALALAVPFQGNAAQLMKSSSAGGTATALCDSYSTLSVSPNGTLTVVDCVASTTGGNTPPVGNTNPAGTFGVAVGDSRQTNVLTPGWTNLVWVSRTGGTIGAVSVSVVVSGGCQLGSDHLDWGNGDATTNAVGMNAPSGITSCTVTLGTATNGGVVDNAARSITMTAAGTTPTNNTGGGGTQSANCTLPIAANTKPVSFGFGVNTLIQMAPGTVAYGPLLSVKTVNPFSTVGQVAFDMTSTSPASGTVEISINHCQGAIDTTPGACYSNYFVPNAVNWSEVSTAALNQCQADPNSNGPWYVNVRFNYTGCGYGQNCGYVGQFQPK